jgi:hypothetical protein
VLSNSKFDSNPDKSIYYYSVPKSSLSHDARFYFFFPVHVTNPVVLFIIFSNDRILVRELIEVLSGSEDDICPPFPIS